MKTIINKAKAKALRQTGPTVFIGDGLKARAKDHPYAIWYNSKGIQISRDGRWVFLMKGNPFGKPWLSFHDQIP